ncbi:MAG: HEAT repeat domain-containing protein [Planctomycetota bacterium]|jgi:Mg-chelatase subunit ChlD
MPVIRTALIALTALLTLGAPAQERAEPGAVSEQERQTVQRLLRSPAWPRRAIAALRLERYHDQKSREQLLGLLDDEAWQVRAFAVRSLGRLRVPLPEGALQDEIEPRVWRAAVRHRYSVDREALARGVNYLARRQNLMDKMLAVELAAASGDPELEALATETARTIILRMNSAEAGVLSVRLVAVTDAPKLHRPWRWHSWLRQVGRSFVVHPGYAIPEDDTRRLEPSLLAQLPFDRFFSLEDYIAKLSERRVDLVVCLDTTASMWDELDEAKAGLDDMMIFASDVVTELRVGLVAYRDKRDSYETRGWDLTSEIALARQRLWQLSAGGGGDKPEAVYPALRAAYGSMSWSQEHTKVLVLVGDAPPHPGFQGQCATMAQRAFDQLELTTHAIQAEGEAVEQFPEIAAAGGGRCVTLESGDSLVAEIAGLTLGDRFAEEFREFFRIYLDLCR